MNFLSDKDLYKSKTSRGPLKHRSKRLDAVVSAIKDYIDFKTLDRLEKIEAAVKTWREQDPKEYADRGKPHETQLASEIQSEMKRLGYDLGNIPIVDPSAHPTYNPILWKSNSLIRNSTNCYAYACDDPYNHAFLDKPQPGTYHEESVNGQMTNRDVRYGVERDDQTRNHMQTKRLIPLISMRDETARQNRVAIANTVGHYLIALFVARGVDYHWLRQDRNGLWSHKPGHSLATNLDASGNLIRDPRDCDMYYPGCRYEFSTFYFAPKGGVRTASLGDWNNPSWTAWK